MKKLFWYDHFETLDISHHAEQEFEFDDDCEDGVIQSVFAEWIMENVNCGIEDVEEKI